MIDDLQRINQLDYVSPANIGPPLSQAVRAIPGEFGKTESLWPAKWHERPESLQRVKSGPTENSQFDFH